MKDNKHSIGPDDIIHKLDELKNNVGKASLSNTDEIYKAIDDLKKSWQSIKLDLNKCKYKKK